MNKRQLYESIMRQVSIQVKKVLNENIEEVEDQEESENPVYECTAEETKGIDEDFFSNAAEMLYEDDSVYEDMSGGCTNETVTIECPYLLGGMSGILSGTITYYLEYTITRDYEVFDDGGGMESAELIFTADDGTVYNVELDL